MTAKTTVASIISDLEQLKDGVKADQSMTLEARTKLFCSIVDRQIRAATLDLAYRKSAARLPESGIGLTTMLASSLPDKTTGVQ